MGMSLWIGGCLGWGEEKLHIYERTDTSFCNGVFVFYIKQSYISAYPYNLRSIIYTVCILSYIKICAYIQKYLVASKNAKIILTFRVYCGIIFTAKEKYTDFAKYNWRIIQMKLKNIKIVSKSNGIKDNFYIISNNGTEYYLFNSRHCNSVFSFYKNGVPYDKAIDFTVAKRNIRICKVMERIPVAVGSILKEYSLI